ncbi:DUF3861 domain-containing protein [Musicola keenii]|uniref:DUF3861 domain-containing protein n=1 Tax=Musicola keenii TaxID=2884250 RepID=UPI00177DA89E|nr:DUF3861 domain-containing protein [Musicola keenii]
MAYQYRITLENITENHTDAQYDRALTFDVVNHDNIPAIIERVRSKGILPQEEVPAFCLGLKLFGEIMMAHRKDPLFQELAPHFRDFMLKLKKGGAETR